MCTLTQGVVEAHRGARARERAEQGGRIGAAGGGRETDGDIVEDAATDLRTDRKNKRSSGTGDTAAVDIPQGHWTRRGAEEVRGMGGGESRA